MRMDVGYYPQMWVGIMHAFQIEYYLCTGIAFQIGYYLSTGIGWTLFLHSKSGYYPCTGMDVEYYPCTGMDVGYYLCTGIDAGGYYARIPNWVTIYAPA